MLETWRDQLGDKDPLSVSNPEPKEPVHDSKRIPDIWQPKWIRDKYFDGRENPNRGRK